MLKRIKDLKISLFQIETISIVTFVIGICYCIVFGSIKATYLSKLTLILAVIACILSDVIVGLSLSCIITVLLIKIDYAKKHKIKMPKDIKKDKNVNYRFGFFKIFILNVIMALVDVVYSIFISFFF